MKAQKLTKFHVKGSPKEEIDLAFLKERKTLMKKV